jgi:hypothetical protein
MEPQMPVLSLSKGTSMNADRTKNKIEPQSRGEKQDQSNRQDSFQYPLEGCAKIDKKI